MPYLHLRTNVAIEDEAALAAALSREAADALGKAERFVMVVVEGRRTMCLGGEDAPCAFLELRSLGLVEEAAKGLSARLCRFLEAELGVPAARTYIAFSSPPRAMWGWNGTTFG